MLRLRRSVGLALTGATFAVLPLFLAPAAGAKFRLALAVSDSRPAVGQPVTVVLRSGVPLDFDLKLIAVAPGRSWYDVVGVVTGESQLARADIPRDGFGVPVVRAAPNRWRAVIRFPRPGRWRLVIPNGAPRGFMIPPPVMEPVRVHRNP
jgi:hypothetical protein